MSKVRVNKKDKYRVLLTEVLPYEVPICFSNEGFYRYVSKEETNAPVLITSILKNGCFKEGWTIPFNFKIRKGVASTRTLSLIHPASQIQIVDFYEKYAHLICHLCTKSSVSLRAPKKIAAQFYLKSTNVKNDSVKDGLVEEETESHETELTYSSSFFVYTKYSFLFKYFDSYDFLRLEKRFKYLLKFDVSKCFNSIYTHSISWAVKDKNFAKEHSDCKSFELIFDKIMQRANYNETNGIVIGPEVSRIFAEIILQKIDINTQATLKKSYGIQNDAQFAIRRYVDDYFLFFNDQKIADKVFAEFQAELENYKMYINEAKNELETIPFITGITMAKYKLLDLVTNLFNSNIEFEEVVLEDGKSEKKYFIKNIRDSNEYSNRTIRDIKGIVKSNKVEYDGITNYILAIVKKKIIDTLKKINYEELAVERKRQFSRFIILLLDVLFFIYSMDSRVRTTYIMSQILVLLNKYTGKYDLEFRHFVSKKIYDETLYLLKSISQQENTMSVEVLNMIVALKENGSEYLIDPIVLSNLLRIRDIKTNTITTSKLNYFQIIILIYYIEDNLIYRDILFEIEDDVCKRYDAEPHPFREAELTCLFFDLIRCPFISTPCKEKLVQICECKRTGNLPTTTETNRIIRFVSRNNWFMNWDAGINLEYELQKKEMKSPYE